MWLQGVDNACKDAQVVRSAPYSHMAAAPLEGKLADATADQSVSHAPSRAALLGSALLEKHSWARMLNITLALTHVCLPRVVLPVTALLFLCLSQLLLVDFFLTYM